MFVDSLTPPIVEQEFQVEAPYIFDMKLADVTGDQVDDFIYLTGSKQSSDAIYEEDVTVYIIDGVTNEAITQSLPIKGGYGGELFVGDFNQDLTADVYVSLSSGESGNIHYYYLYSFKNKKPVKLFDYEVFNQLSDWTVQFLDQYKVELHQNKLHQTFILDISKQNPQLLLQYYALDGSVKGNIKGEVLPLGGLAPTITPIGNGAFNLVASQRIIGITMVDAIGVVETYLTFRGEQFVPYTIIVGEHRYLK